MVLRGTCNDKRGDNTAVHLWLRMGSIARDARAAAYFCVGRNFRFHFQRALVCSLWLYPKGPKDWLFPLVVVVSFGGIGAVRAVTPNDRQGIDAVSQVPSARLAVC